MMRVLQADEAAADPVVVKPVDSVTTVDAAVATAASAGAQAEPARQGDVSAAGAAQSDTAGSGAGTVAGATRAADVITPGSARVEAMLIDAAVAQQAAAALTDSELADIGSTTAATAVDRPAEGTDETALPVPAAAEAVSAAQAADPVATLDSGPRLGTAARQSVTQPLAADSNAAVADRPHSAETTTGSFGSQRTVSDPDKAAAAAASDSAAGDAAFVQQPGLFGAQQRRQVVARLPGRRRGHAPLSEAQQRLQRQWQASDVSHCMSHVCTGKRMSVEFVI